MAVGTLLTGGAIVRLFGAYLLPLRLAGWACVAIAIALPYCCMLSKEQRRENLHWLALAYLLMGYGAFQEFSPGTLTVLLLSALWVSAIKWETVNHKFEILTAILAGLAVSVRFPNILVLLVLIPLWRKRSLWNIPIAALSAGVVYMLGYWFVTPAVTDSAMSSHELIAMLTKLWENGGKLAGYALMAVGVLAVGHYTIHRTPYTIHFTPYIVGLALCYFIAYAIKPMQWYNTDLTYLIAAFCIVTAITPSLLNSFTPSLLFGTAIMLVATLGTDTAWLKLFPAVLCLLPIAATTYAPQMKRYLFIVLAVMSGMVMLRMTTNSVGQSNLTRVQTISSLAPYQGIAIRESEEQRLKQYRTDYDSLSNVQCPMSNILSVGQECHLMRAVTGCEAARFNEFWSNIFDSVYTAKYRDIIRAERPIVFCSFSPQFKTKAHYKDKESAFEQMLRAEGYRAEDRANYKYMIYIPDYGTEIR